MNLQHLGTDYGGWWVDLDLLPQDGVVIDAGIGTDLSFAQAIKELRPRMRFVGVDHTEDSEKYVALRAIPDYKLVRAAVIGAGHDGKVVAFRNPKLGSESIYSDHSFVNPHDSYQVPVVRLNNLVAEFKPCLVKLDIEGAEYECWKDCLGVQQVCIEFHHRMMKTFSSADTQAIIDAFVHAGYQLLKRTQTDEVLLVKA